MKDKFEIRVIATDGNIIKKILWIKRENKEMYFGIDIPESGKYSYHKSGKFHYKNKQYTLSIGENIPLADFKGRFDFGTLFTYTKDFEKLPHVDFNYRKVDGLVYVDIRTIDPVSAGFNTYFQFVEAGKFDLIRYFPDIYNIHIFTFSNPWVVIQSG